MLKLIPKEIPTADLLGETKLIRGGHLYNSFYYYLFFFYLDTRDGAESWHAFSYYYLLLGTPDFYNGVHRG